MAGLDNGQFIKNYYFCSRNKQSMRNDTEDIYRQKVNRVIDYISANLHQPLSLDTVAEQIFVSQRQLLRIMRLALNEPLYAYIARQRVERAVMYMQTEQTSLTQLAGMVGYDSPQSFSKAFKKLFGTSPKAYMNDLPSRLENYIQSSGNRQERLQAEICEIGDLELVYIRIIGKYAVYTLKGCYSGLQELYNNISINFPYSLRHGMAFEEYLNSPRETTAENLLTKIFIPIKY